MDLDQLWQNILKKMHESISNVMYDTWFGETKIHSIENGTINVIVPFELHKKMLKEKYNSQLEEIIYEITNTNLNIAYFTEEDLQKNIELKVTETEKNFGEKFNSSLNPNYTFDNFIVGASNRFAHV